MKFKRKILYVASIATIAGFSFRELNRYGAFSLPDFLQWWADLDNLILGWGGHPHGDGYALINYVFILGAMLFLGALRLPKPKELSYDLKGVPEDARPTKIEGAQDVVKLFKKHAKWVWLKGGEENETV